MNSARSSKSDFNIVDRSSANSISRNSDFNKSFGRSNFDSRSSPVPPARKDSNDDHRSKSPTYSNRHNPIENKMKHGSPRSSRSNTLDESRASSPLAKKTNDIKKPNLLTRASRSSDNDESRMQHSSNSSMHALRKAKDLESPRSSRSAQLNGEKRINSPDFSKGRDRRFIEAVFDHCSNDRIRRVIDEFKDFQKALNYAGFDFERSKLDELWSKNKQRISFETFENIIEEETPIDDDSFRKAFEKLYRKDKKLQNFSISYEQFHRDMTKTGDKLSEEEFDRIRSSLGTKEGKINIQTLLEAIVETKKSCREKILKSKQEEDRKKPSEDEKLIHSSRSTSERTTKTTKTITIRLNPGKNDLNIDKQWKHSIIKGALFCEAEARTPVEYFSLSYAFKIEKPTDISFVLEPVLSRYHRDKTFENIDVRFLLFKVDPKTEKLQLIYVSSERFEKQTFLKIKELGYGFYEILPMTFGCCMKLRSTRSNETKPTIKLREKNKGGEFVMTEKYKDALSYVFDLFDLQDNKKIDRVEYNLWTKRTSNDSITDEDWAQIQATLELDVDESISLKKFLELNNHEVTNDETTEDDLWKGLQSIGFNKNLEIDQMCPFTLTTYTNSDKIILKPKEYVKLSEIKKKLLSFLVEKAEETDIPRSDLIFHRYEDNCGFILFVENQEENRTRQFSMELAESVNSAINSTLDLMRSLNISVGPKKKELVLVAHRLKVEQEMNLTLTLQAEK